jgi:hypothetical protein
MVQYCLVRKRGGTPILFDDINEVTAFIDAVSIESGWHMSSLYKLTHLGDYTTSTNFIPTPKE